MSKRGIVASWIAASTLLSGCSFFYPLLGETTSVEAVLRQTKGVGDQLDREEREALVRDGRTVSALPALTLEKPIRAKTQLSSRFGNRDGRKHTGVDLSAPEGTQIRAAADGIVVYTSDGISGYGLTVIIRHTRGRATLYAHTSEVVVVEGQYVTAGQTIAYVGSTGNASGPHLHFELRESGKPVDPISALTPKPDPN